MTMSSLYYFVLDQHALVILFYCASSLKQQSADRHDLIPSQTVTTLTL
jgi:hypothetical protein